MGEHKKVFLKRMWLRLALAWLVFLLYEFLLYIGWFSRLLGIIWLMTELRTSDESYFGLDEIFRLFE